MVRGAGRQPLLKSDTSKTSAGNERHPTSPEGVRASAPLALLHGPIVAPQEEKASGSVAPDVQT